jgi:DNA-binding IclR family transcriptional regulator
MGILLLSRLSDVAVDRVARRLNAEQRDATRHVQPSELLAAVQATRKQGYAFSVGGITAGGGALAMFLPEAVGGSPLAIAIGAAETNLVYNRDMLVAALRSAITRHYPTDRPRARRPQSI